MKQGLLWFRALARLRPFSFSTGSLRREGYAWVRGPGVRVESEERHPPGFDHAPEDEDRVRCSKEEANLVGSLCDDGLHRPVLDLDFPCRLVPSSTEGHFHLYLEVALETEPYLRLVRALAEAKVVSAFYAKAAEVRRQTFVRPEWVKKEPKELEGEFL